MQGFNLLQKGKLITALKNADIYKLRELSNMINVEIERRKRKELKGLKK